MPDIRHPALPAMFRLCLYSGYPTAFEDDFLWHDQNLLRTMDPAIPFIWVLRRCGTHLWPEDDLSCDTLRTLLRTMEVAHIAVWDGKSLRDYSMDIDGAAVAVRTATYNSRSAAVKKGASA